ncbi:LysR family transcriptional regulator [Chitinimonas naiadis]
MKQIDLNRLAVFAAVVDAGGFTAAAERLGQAKSQVSLQIGRLEAELGVSLFTRSTRRVAVTEAGEQLHADCAPLLLGLQDAIVRISAGGRLDGRLRVTAGLAYSDSVLGGLLARFAALHPALDIELVASDSSLDLLAEGLDLAIRGGVLRDSSLKAVKLGGFEQVPVASPALLARMGVPRRPMDLHGQPWVALTVLPAPLTWQFSAREGDGQDTIRGRAVMRVNSASVVRQCARTGVGVAVLPDYMIRTDLEKGELLELLPDWRLPRAGIYAVYPRARYLPAKVRALIDFLQAELGKH